MFPLGRKFTGNRFSAVILIMFILFLGMLPPAAVADNTGVGAAGRAFRGIVEENNPQLGYITLYNDDGTGTDPEKRIELIELRTFNYAPDPFVKVTKNYRQAEPGDISAGDLAFIRLDDEGRVVEISAVSNFTPRYGKVISKKPSSITVRYDDGSVQLLAVNSEVIFIAEGRVVDYSALKEGDRVRLLLEITPGATVIREVTIESGRHHISNIYRGSIERINTVSRSITIRNLEVFSRGMWVRTGVSAYSTIKLADEYFIYENNRKLDIETAARYYNYRDAYIAVEKDYGGKERAVVLSYINKSDSEIIINDSIESANTSYGLITLAGSFKALNFGEGSIIVKDGRLVTGLSLSEKDTAYIAALRDYYSGDYFAAIVQVSSRTSSQPEIYRGRIRSINEFRDFTVESFSRLDGTSWEYANTPKTFKITYDTRILDDKGLVNPRNFVGYGKNSYVGRVVYIVASETDALLVSTAPFGPGGTHVKGMVYEMTGLVTDESGQPIDGPTGLGIARVKYFDPEDFTWKDNPEMELNLLENTIFLKGDKIIEARDIKKGDEIRVYMGRNGNRGDAYIVMVEE